MVFILFLLFWIILNGKLTWEIVLFGVALSALLYAFICRFMGFSIKKDWQMVKKIPNYVRYIGLLIKEIFLANLHVARLILSQKYEVEPKLVTFHTKLTKSAERALLADSITLTPGTITANLEEDKLTVHCLDGDLAQGLEDSSFEKALLIMEEGSNTHD